MTLDEKYMARCLYLATLGQNTVAPNPMVGAVIVKQGRIIGEGYHQEYGCPHAEPNAINSVVNSEDIEGSTLYVNLEPCSHYGKTPPCAKLVAEKKIARVVIGSLDPNPKVSGKGVDILRKAGIDVSVGVLEKESRELNEHFMFYQKNKLPYVFIKWAQTADGFIDYYRKDLSQKPLSISNQITMQLTHKMRAENMAIMVGTDTVLLDNPSLTVRNWQGRNPIRIIIDRNNRIPSNYRVKNGVAPTIIYTESIYEDSMSRNLEYVTFPRGGITLRAILEDLYNRSINSVLVEGGAELLNSFIREGLWNEANVETSRQRIVHGVKSPSLPIACVETEQIIEGHRWTHFRNNM